MAQQKERGKTRTDDEDDTGMSLIILNSWLKLVLLLCEPEAGKPDGHRAIEWAMMMLMSASQMGKLRHRGKVSCSKSYG